MINSFDIFDTIIGRLCYKGTEIFEIYENTFYRKKYYSYDDYMICLI